MDRLISEYTRTGLVRMCETAGLAMSGTKEDLAKRLLEAGITSDEQREENSREMNASGYYGVDAESKASETG